MDKVNSIHHTAVHRTVIEAVDTLHNGNVSDFGLWVKKATKLQILDAIEYYSGRYGNRHIIVNYMRRYLEVGR